MKPKASTPKRIKKKQRTSLAVSIIFSLIALFALTVAIVVLLFNYSLKNQIEQLNSEKADLIAYNNEHPYSQEDLDNQFEVLKEQYAKDERQELLNEIKDVVSNGNSSYYLMRSLFPNDVVLMAETGFDFIPVDPNLKKASLAVENYYQDADSDEVLYAEDEKVISQKGIDVSSHNGKIDWTKVKDDNVTYCIVRMGYRGSTEGKLATDTTFEYNISNAIKNGIETGVYFYTQAINEEEAIEEAKYVLDAIEAYDVKGPICYDIEDYPGGRADNLEPEVYTACTKAFCKTIKDAGYEPMIYGNLNTFFRMLNVAELEEYDKWFAAYMFPVYYPYEYKIWQYSSSGSVMGIKGKVDMNIRVVK